MSNPGNYIEQPVHNPNDMHNRRTTTRPASPRLSALDFLADHLRQQIVWELSHEPRTPTELARALERSQPLISKHLRTAGLVQSHPSPHDRRARVYNIRREPLIAPQVWLNDIQTAWPTRPPTPADPDSYKGHLDPKLTTRGTPRKRIPRALKEPREH